MDKGLLILAVFLLLFAFFLYIKNKQLLDELKKIKADISEIENIGNLLSVTESTLEEAEKTIATAKRIMDDRIRRMETLLKKFDQSVRRVEKQEIKDNINERPLSEPKVSSNDKPVIDISESDAYDRAAIAQRNKEIIVMLGDGIPLEEIARKTGASMREIRLIKKFI